MVLSNKKLKQKLREAKASLLAESEAQNRPSNGNLTKNTKSPPSIPQESVKSLLDSVAQRPRISKREKKRKRFETLQENGENLKRDDDGDEDGNKEEKRKEQESEAVVEEDKKRKKKRKRDDENGLENEEVKKVEEKKKKKKKKKQKKKGKKEKEVENTEVKESLEIGGGDSTIVQGLQETANTGDGLEACTKVYVGGIPYYSSEDDIRSYFESCGSITEIDCLTFPDSGKFRGIAIISFKTEAAAKRALALDGSDMGGLFLKIQPYKSAKAGKSPSFAPAIVEGYNRIYAGNLSWEITEDDLKSLFAGCNIASIRFGEDKETKEFKGYAHVDFSDGASLNSALKLDQNIVCGRPVRISAAVPRKGPSVNKTQTPGEKRLVTKIEPAPENNSADGDAAVSGKIKRSCYECGERDHLSSSCPKKQAVEQTEPPPENNPSHKDAVTDVTAVSGKIKRRTCYECGERGHLSSSYPKKQAVEQTEPPPENNPSHKDAVTDVTAVSGKIKRRTCYECGERGHLSSSCPKKQAAEQTEPPPENNPSDKDAVTDVTEVTAVSGKIRRRTCYECGERGHLSSSCPKKQPAEQTNLITS